MVKVNPQQGYIVVRDLPKGDLLGLRKVTNRGRVQIPGPIKRELGLMDGDMVWWVRNQAGEIFLAKAMKLE